MKKMAEEDYLEVSFLICICALKEARNCKGHLQIFLQIWPCQVEWWGRTMFKGTIIFYRGKNCVQPKVTRWICCWKRRCVLVLQLPTLSAA
jgi:hypothetical protein